MLKYVTVKINGMESTVVFPPHINHCLMARILDLKPISAGFVSFRNDEDGNPMPVCFGKSETLNLESRKEDTHLIQMAHNF